MIKNLYMVPYDFTSIGEKALKYALYLADQKLDIEIKLLHIAKNDETKKVAEEKLEEIIKNTPCAEGSAITYLVKVGHFLEDIGRIANEEKVQLVVMGTHGSVGMQRIMGSHAMKVITSADCPFLVMQEATEIKKVENILIPIDLTKESLQIINVAADMANILGAKLHIVSEKQTDPLLYSRLKNRIGLVEEELEKEGIEPKIKLFDRKGSFSSKIMKYAKSNEMEMIAFAYYSESLFVVLDTFGQKLITNKLRLPVLVLNSKQSSSLYF